MRKPGYYTYGEGSIHHSPDRPCEEGLTRRHPIIVRETWPSKRAYYKNKVAVWWFHRQAGRIVLDDGPPDGEGYGSFHYRWNPLDRPMHRLFGDPFPHTPRLSVGIKNEDSIYDRSNYMEKEAAGE